MAVMFVNRFCHPDHSATSQMLSDLAAGLAARGLSVTMLASRLRYDDAAVRLPAQEEWRGVRIRRLWTSGFGRRHLIGRALDYLTFYVGLPWALWRTLHAGDVVVAKTDPPLLGVPVSWIARLRGARVVHWVQDVFPEVALQLGEPRLPMALANALRRLRNRSMRGAAMNVLIGQRMAELFDAQGIAAERLQVIENWAHEDLIQPMPPAHSRLRQSLQLVDGFVIGYAGNLGRAHDVDTIAAAAERLRDDERIAWLIIGGGHGHERLRERCRAAGLTRVHFLPYQPIEALADAMAAADLHLVSLQPALEGLIVPSKFYGIAAAGRAIAFIGDGDGELARLIAQNDCGFFVSPGQDGRLAATIAELASSPSRAVQWGARARALLDARYTRDAAHRRWHDLLVSLGATSRR